MAGSYEYESETSTSTNVWNFLSLWLKYKLINKDSNKFCLNWRLQEMQSWWFFLIFFIKYDIRQI